MMENHRRGPGKLCHSTYDVLREVRVRPDHAALRGLEGCLRRAERTDGAGEDAALSRLIQETAIIEGLIDRVRGEAGQRLPVRRGEDLPRIDLWVERLLKGGETAPTEAALLEALRTADFQPALTMAELWAVPAALRRAAVRGLWLTGRGILRTARAEAAAGTWVRHPRGRKPRRDPAFCARALRLCREEGLAAPCAALESALRARGEAPEGVARAAHDAAAARLVKLDNLLAVRRLADTMDWQARFEALSPVEAELRQDPSGVYPSMDDASRQAVREQVAALARRLRAAELSVARHAVAAAREALSAEDGETAVKCAESRAYVSAEDADPVPPHAAKPEATCCWWLYDDAGRQALAERMGKARARLPRMVPDPSGRGVMLTVAALAGAVFALLVAWVDAPWLWLACAVLAWGSADRLVGAAFPRWVKPARLLKLEYDALPEACRTLVVTPVLLPDADSARSACANLETLGALNRDPNVEYLLLGDFADADGAECPGDGAVLEAVSEGIAALNARVGRGKYHWLHRPRVRLEPDGRWMGRDRKRGALMALNRLLLGQSGAGDAFMAGDLLNRTPGRFAFVVTLDADTRWLPGDVQRLAGAMAHPLNRRWAVMQPRMELTASACGTRFTRLYGGAGGMDAYPVCLSNLWMDLTGQGIYAGKGIYNVAAFQQALEGALPEGRVLSHDLIEGAVAHTAFLGDVALYDACPETLGGWLKRLHRWTRGDWQLLPLMLCRRPLPNGRRLAATDRFRMFDNLIRSLEDAALLALLFAAAWTGSVDRLAMAALLCFLDPLSSLPARDGGAWRRAEARLATLPVTALTRVDAALRALWRLYVSGRRLMDWVPSAHVGGGMPFGWAGPVTAALMLPGLILPGNAPMALALAALFWAGPGWVRGMEAQSVAGAEPLTEHQEAMLRDMARDTWRFFAENVTATCPLPPDNVQLDPPVGAARRTSPTNVGLYLVSCAAAEKLGFIDFAELRARLTNALDALDQCEKWRGHLPNWIDLDSLAALPPRYVSSVDSGNLAACALLCAALMEAREPALARRLRALAEDMDFRALYDAGRHLFYIGAGMDDAAPGQSHYDLLASESRILSFTALLLGQVPLRHWRRLGRPAQRVAGDAALMSWSGTLFEYLMPELLMPAPTGSLVGVSVRAAVREQARVGAAQGRPWGISESGYCAFDAAMNYQYRAFGLKRLALGGEADGGVVAPYAAALALAAYPGAAARNLENMDRLGWRGRWGFYEAADYLRPRPEGGPALVRSHMAHHQGMALCAMCNALTGGSLADAFMGQPGARALSLLLEERVPAVAANARRHASTSPTRLPGARRGMRAEGRLADVHLLVGAKARTLMTAWGGAHYHRDGFDATRFFDNVTEPFGTALIWLRVEGGAITPLGGQGCRAACDAGSAVYTQEIGSLECELRACLSPEDDTLFRVLTVTNAGRATVRVEAADAFPVSLARPADMRAHGAFQHLFVEASPLGERGLMLTRRPRNPGEVCPALVHAAFGAEPVAVEADCARLFGRAGGLKFDFSGKAGAPLNPASGLRVPLVIAPGAQARVCFALCLLDDPAEADAWLERCSDAARPGRAERLGRARTEALLADLGVKPGAYQRLDRLSALLLDSRLAARAKRFHRPCAGVARKALWRAGISGDRPILLMTVTDPGRSAPVREIIAAHGLYRAMGLVADLVFIDDCPGVYRRPCRDMLAGCVASGGLAGREGVAGGVWVLDGDALEPDTREALERAAAMAFSSNEAFQTQAAALLRALDIAPGLGMSPLDPGPSDLPAEPLECANGYGGFGADGAYVIDVTPDRPTPAPWCDILADDAGGLLVTERGGGFLWHGNSRFNRLTEYRGDPQRERRGLTVVLYNPETCAFLRLLPGEIPMMPFRARFSPDAARYAFATRDITGSATLRQAGSAHIKIVLENRHLPSGPWRVAVVVDWLMGAEAPDAAWLSTWSKDGACFASGAMPGVGWLACAAVDAAPELNLPFLPNGSGCLAAPVALSRGARIELRFAVGWAQSVAVAETAARAFRQNSMPALSHAPEGPVIRTPDAALDRLVNAFLPHQVLASRVLGRTGYYQPGGAYGFRDQLQDMLALLPRDPARVRRHLLACAARQFEAGDALHWWHPPFTGVRTRIQDDRLFLPYVTAQYVKWTGDVAVLSEQVPYLADVPIPEGREDLYGEMRPGAVSETLHGHCMAAFRAVRVGGHGLALMGAGDWNDGMNRVGASGAGESVWLSEFLSACVDTYADIAPDPDAAWLRRLAQAHRTAVETHGWDGAWYRRAFADDGTVLGGADSPACQIDLIAQAWAVLARLGSGRCGSAMRAARARLVDEARRLVRLLDPPFDRDDFDPGYIRGYPAGVRENGAQYTHGACWYLLALIRMGDAPQAHRVLQMLLPTTHAATPEAVARYRVEPYVMAGDICALPGMEGRGGWTWYTGSAAWMLVCVYALLGFERRGNRVRLNALLGDWPEVSLTLRQGGSIYRLICRAGQVGVTLDGTPVDGPYVILTDDGGTHEAVFPPR